MIAFVVIAVLSGAPKLEVLTTERFRAVTLTPGESKQFKIPEVDRLTANSGNCLEESLDTEEEHTLVITAKCGGVRTSMVWLKNGEKIQMLACAEDDHSTPAAKKLRAKLQTELKAYKSVTPCARYGRVELLGWVEKQTDIDKISAIAIKNDADDKVELLGQE
ncbi:MAG: hypothetical protein QM723_25950 [Myxococcaceae bacterium]